MPIDVFAGDVVDFKVAEVVDPVEFTFTNTDGKNKVEVVTAQTHPFTFAAVPPGLPNYTVSWKYKVPDAQDFVSGPDTYRVWPTHLKLDLEMQGGAKGSVEGFQFKLQRGEEEAKPFTAAEATWSGELTKAAYKFEAVAPWKIEASTPSDAEAARHTLKLSQMPWTAKIVSHDGGADKDHALKQYVNLDNADGTVRGHRMKVEVAPNDRQLGLKGQKISVVVTFPATNSKRNDPRPALWIEGKAVDSVKKDAVPGVEELVYKAQLSLPANGGSCVFHVELGQAGGDLCHIQVGFDDGDGDQHLWIQNWRRLQSEWIVPHTSLRQPWATICNNDDDAPAPHADFLGEVKRILDPLFIEVEFPAAYGKAYKASDLDAVLAARDGAKTFVMKGSEVSNKLVANRNCTFLAPADLDLLRARVLGNDARDPRRLAVVWTDMLPKTLGDDSEEVEAASPGEYYFEFEDANPSPAQTPAGKDLMAALRNPLCKPDASDLPGVEKVYWYITGVRKPGEAAWKTLQEVWEYGDADMTELHKLAKLWDTDKPQHVAPASVAEAANWVDFLGLRSFQIKLPNGGPATPGHYVSWNGFEHKIMVTVGLRHFKQGANANAIQGMIRMTPTVGLGTAAGVARTFCHEIGHNLGHTYFENQGDATDGRGRLKKYEIPGVPFEKVVPDGNFYAGKGHRGAHCASALKTAGKHRDDKFNKPEHMRDDNCVLFGAGNQLVDKKFSYCVHCTTYIKASDATDISRNWKA